MPVAAPRLRPGRAGRRRKRPVDEVQHRLAGGQGDGHARAAERFELDGGLTVRGIGQEHRELVAHAQDRHGLVTPQDRLGQRPSDLQVDHLVRQLDERDVQRLGQRPAELLLRDRAHSEQELADAVAPRPLARQGLVQLLARDEPALDQDLAQPLRGAHACDLRTISWASSPRRTGENGLVRWAAAPMPSLSSPYAGSSAAGEHDDGDAGRRRLPAEAGDGGVAVHLGHHHVRDDELRTVPRGQIEELQPIAGRERLEAGFHERVADQFADLGLVVGDEREGPAGCRPASTAVSTSLSGTTLLRDS